MNCLIIGCSGQDGLLLSKELNGNNHKVYGVLTGNSKSVKPEFKTFFEDLVNIQKFDKGEYLDLIKRWNIDCIYYLASLSSVMECDKNPTLAMEVNFLNYLKILEVIDLNELNLKIVYASSILVFETQTIVVNEASPKRARNLYQLTKLVASEVSRIYRSKGLKVSVAFLSNHESYLRDSRFVTGKIIEQLRSVNEGVKNVIELGNIEVYKDWSDAEDVMRGLRLLGESDLTDDVIFASGETYQLSELVKKFVELSSVNSNTKVVSLNVSEYGEKNEFFQLDISKAKKYLGWKPTTSIEHMIYKILSYNSLKA